MSQAPTAAGMDRLPWLADERAQPQRKRKRTREGAGWAALALAAVAGAAYWIGAHGWSEPGPEAGAGKATQVLPLPPPRSSDPVQPQVSLQHEPEVALVTPRDVPMAPPRPERSKRRPSPEPAKGAAADTPEKQSKPAEPAAATPAPKAAQPPALPVAWPATRSAGASGRIVRVGAFASRQQAKLGWRRMVTAYPAMAHLKATVVGSRNSRGRHFYRFQIGTTSQAHSEVLCQRMQRIHLSCAVVGLSWKPSGVER